MIKTIGIRIGKSFFAAIGVAILVLRGYSLRAEWLHLFLPYPDIARDNRT